MPAPPDYGGAIEQFFKIKWLHRLGVKIHLHCFTKHRPAAPALKSLCASVDYYPRATGIRGLSPSLPYIISSRKHPALLKNLTRDNYPVLMEGVHCTYFLPALRASGRKIAVRLHNVEHKYYQELASHESNWFRKLYFHWESLQLKKYETKLARSASLFALSTADADIFRKEFGAADVHFIPAFVGWETVTTRPGDGCFCLYHGNLSVNENEKAATWLLEAVFAELDIPFVIAGKSPSPRLAALVDRKEHTCLVANPGETEMQDIIAKAQLHILPSFNKTGVKLKLLNALYSGRHCLVNKAGVAGSGLEALCTLAEDADDFKTAISYLYKIPFDEAEKEKRESLLMGLNNNRRNAEEIINFFWP